VKVHSFIAGTSLFVIAAFATPSSIHAAIVTIRPDGNAVWNVLGAQTDETKIEVKKVAMVGDISNVQTVHVQKEGDKVQVKMQKNGITQVADATGYNDTLVEVEARDNIRKIEVSTADGQFVLHENGLVAKTEYPVEIDSEEAKIGVKAPSGIRYLEVLPQTAFETLVNARTIDEIDKTNEAMTLTEDNAGELHYVVHGEKALDLKVYKMNVPVTATLSATTGKLLTVDAPIWFKVIGFFIS